MHNLNFISVSKYSNVGEPFTNMRFNNMREERLFKGFTEHPLLLWHLEFIQGTIIVPFDLITNITGNVNHKGAVHINGIHFVNSPCLVCEYGDFANLYNKRSEHELYAATRNLVEEYRTKAFISKLNAIAFDGLVFHQQNFQGLINIGLKK